VRLGGNVGTVGTGAGKGLLQAGSGSKNSAVAQTHPIKINTSMATICTSCNRKISPPAVYAYDCTPEKAVDIIWDCRLRDCELLSDPVLMLDFLNDTDLCHFKMAFGEDLDFTDNSAFARPTYKGQIESFLVESGMRSRVTRREILAVAFWTMADKVTFDTELYIRSLQP
jgi:hypothetical protein